MFKLFFLFLGISSNVIAGTLHCEVKDLATADILASKTINNISANDLKTGMRFTLEHYLVISSFEFSTQNGQLVFEIQSQEEDDHDELLVTFTDQDLLIKRRLGATSISSAAANLDTMYSYCDFDPRN